MENKENKENKVCTCKGDFCTCAYGKSADRVTSALIVGGFIVLGLWLLKWLLKKANSNIWNTPSYSTSRRKN